MNRYALLSIVFVGILVALGVVYFFPRDGSGPTAGPVDPETARLRLAIETAESACLSNVSSTRSAEITTNLKIIKEGLTAGGKINSSDDVVRGASQKLQDALQLQENDSIRECMNMYMPQIMEQILGSVPNPLEFRFDFAAADPSDTQFRQDVVTLNLWSDTSVPGPVNLVRQPAKYYTANIQYPKPAQTFQGRISRAVADETENLRAGVSGFCIKRPDPLPHIVQHYAYFACEEGKPCTKKTGTPKWLDTCAVQDARLRQLPHLISTAHAQEAASFWAVPSYATWRERLPSLKGIGYTLFQISTDAFEGTGAYGVRVALWVNGTPVYEDGLQPKDRPQPYDGKGAFTYNFGLRAVDLQGLHAGCDELRVELTPLTEPGTPSQPVTFRRMYVALRDAEPMTLKAGEASLSWTGTYEKPQEEYEAEVFVASILYAGGDDWKRFADNRDVLDRARGDIDRIKSRFDALGLTFDGQPLVAVIRPPLTKPSFGIAVGIKRASGQIQFTMPVSEADSLRRDMLEKRTSWPGASGVIDRGTYVYGVATTAERREHGTPPGVCDGLL